MLGVKDNLLRVHPVLMADRHKEYFKSYLNDLYAIGVAPITRYRFYGEKENLSFTFENLWSALLHSERNIFTLSSCVRLGIGLCTANNYVMIYHALMHNISKSPMTFYNDELILKDNKLASLINNTDDTRQKFINIIKKYDYNYLSFNDSDLEYFQKFKNLK